MSFNFEYVTERTGIQRFMSISKYGISLNRPVLDHLRNARQVVIGYDQTKNVVGIFKYLGQETFPRDVKLFPLNDRPKSDGTLKDWIRISCRPFIRHLGEESGIDFSQKTHKLLAELIDNGVVAALGQISEGSTG